VIRRFDHVAMAFYDLRPALELFRDVLGGKCVQAVSDDNGFDVLQFEFPDGSRVEALAPGAAPGFVDKFLSTRGEGLHHLTFFVDNLHEAVELCRGSGYKVVEESYSNDEWMEAFLSPTATHGVLIQLVQSSLDLAGQDKQYWAPGGPEEVIRRADLRRAQARGHI
jgi:methylmalonyl-CoA/ethylmalonyl-CoA epimerase